MDDEGIKCIIRGKRQGDGASTAALVKKYVKTFSQKREPHLEECGARIRRVSPPLEECGARIRRVSPPLEECGARPVSAGGEVEVWRWWRNRGRCLRKVNPFKIKKPELDLHVE